jgi:hypothetical protein
MNGIIDLKEIPEDGELWEQFAQEFLASTGLATESPPDRGADGGKDILMIEHISGPIHSEVFRWLVSCKHTAKSGVAISETTHEKNILERLRTFRADGFLAFYSTLPTSGLNNRLRALTDSRDLKSYKVFSGNLIKNELLSLGRTWIIRRYFPESYKRIRPIHNVLDRHIDLKCDNCGKDLLEELYTSDFQSVIAQAFTRGKDRIRKVHAIYCSCKGACDKVLETRAYKQYNALTSWEDISDIAMPNQFLRFIVANMNQLRSGDEFSAEAFEKQKHVIMAVAQKVFREVTDEERERMRAVLQIPNLF